MARKKHPSSKQSPRGKKNAARHAKRAGLGFKGRGLFWRVFGWVLALSLWVVMGVAGVATWLILSAPDPQSIALPVRERGIVILADNGEVIAERGSFIGDEVRLDELPKHVYRAILAIEDRRFYDHIGLDFLALLRASWANVKAGRIVQGGSTITQQLAKNLFLTRERTLWRKFHESVLSLWLEHNFSKNEILQLYLNRIWFGGRKAGIDHAARFYFDKSARNLSLTEAAMLAGLLKAPSRLNPRRYPERARKRAGVVLSAMARAGFIVPALAEFASAAALPHTSNDRSDESIHYAIDHILKRVEPYTAGSRNRFIIETTLNPALQELMERTIRTQMISHSDEKRVSQAAGIMLAPNGAIKAMIGGVSYRNSHYNRATTARRQPGSAFKPFVWLTAIEAGYNPDSYVTDSPICAGNWCPRNYDNQYEGRMTLRNALARSRNTISAKLALSLGARRIAGTAYRMGIRSSLVDNATIALGSSEVSLLELTAAYIPFSNGGRGVVPWIITSIRTDAGKSIYVGGSSGVTTALTPDALDAMNGMLTNALTIGTGRAAQLTHHHAGGKTGTTQDHRDAWFIGYTAYYTTGIWVGNDDNTPTKAVSGSGLPARIWHDIMETAHLNLSPQTLSTTPHANAPAKSGGLGDFIRNLIGAPPASDYNRENTDERTPRHPIDRGR